ncbi:DoxX-like family protein [Paenibacillus pini]|uniref:DoxX-like family protein n=1 Tax=Paenibacillus pini JCM 16418 TaxID=1236976 RepID=W7YYV3_9BACL|nr:DoxX-like family protein [Paenibacillus pini]GAF09816.1 hypothetical protein JCM16418_3972 [Paenibacillus pini JCM 16418]
MKKQQPIYVQTDIHTSIEELWEHTQNPDLHTAWDVRFTEISYLEREDEEPQRFLYTTKIGMGLEISGEGESIGQIEKESGDRISSLKFWTHHPLSLIRSGRGYWKYTPEGDHIGFETLYHYETSFGKLGEWMDTYLFRPMLGWATAWSFDALKIWLEKGYHPRLLLQRTMTYWIICCLIAFVWIYQGLVPKLITAHPEEISMLSSMAPVPGDGKLMIRIVGILEMVFGVIWLLPFSKRKWFLFHMIIVIGLTISAGMANLSSFVSPFNPVTLNVMLIIVSWVGYINSKHLPRARNCRRRKEV